MKFKFETIHGSTWIYIVGDGFRCHAGTIKVVWDAGRKVGYTLRVAGVEMTFQTYTEATAFARKRLSK